MKTFAERVQNYYKLIIFQMVGTTADDSQDGIKTNENPSLDYVANPAPVVKKPKPSTPPPAVSDSVGNPPKIH